MAGRHLAGLAAILVVATAPVAAFPIQPQRGANATAAPAPGTPQRRAILDALRPAVEAELGPTEFVVNRISVRRGWAFVLAQPQRPGGARIRIPEHLREQYEIGGLEVTAVLQFRYSRWNLVRHSIGATDVWYCGLFPRGASPVAEC